MSVYSTGTRVLAAAAWTFCAFFAVNLMLTGTTGTIWHFLPSLLLVAWGIYLLLWRPRLVVLAEGVAVVNILRVHRIPFGALRNLRVAQNVSLDTTAGRIASWGAPGAGRLGPGLGQGNSGHAARAGGRSSAAGAPRNVQLPHSQTSIESAWNAWEQAASDRASASGGGPGRALPSDAAGSVVTSRWDAGSVVVTVVLVALVAASILT